MDDLSKTYISRYLRIYYIAIHIAITYIVLMPSLKEMDKNCTPRERLCSFGTSALTDTELFALVIRSGTKDADAIQIAESIMKNYADLKEVYNASTKSLRNIHGLGVGKACSIKAGLELGVRIKIRQSFKREVIKSPTQVFEVIRKDLYGKQQEHLVLLSMDSRVGIISKDIISVGTVNETLIHPREIFRKAIERGAVSIILAHNHPSEDTTPSSEDIDATHQVMAAGKELGIPLLDHLVISDTEFTSMKSLGLISWKGGE